MIHGGNGTKRIFTVFLMAVMVSGMLFISPGGAGAQTEEEFLVEEANRLTYEILDLKARRRAAREMGEVLQAELRALEESITSAQDEMDSLRKELAACRDAYERSLRTLYMQDDISELEVILESRALEELWRDVDYLDRLTESHLQVLDRLKSNITTYEIKERNLREYRERRERLAEALDSEALDSRIAALESRLSEINAKLRVLRSKRGAPSSPSASPAPSGRTVPPPGKLLERVPTMPPLSNFERTGIIFSGYTTSYGAEFHGNPTASGVIFNMYDFTCAHRTLPFGTWLLVTYQGRQVIVQVNDRGPFVPGRVLDLSWAAARSIGLDGVKWTEFEIIVPRGN